jgi:hypothetical protein
MAKGREYGDTPEVAGARNLEAQKACVRTKLDENPPSTSGEESGRQGVPAQPHAGALSVLKPA